MLDWLEKRRFQRLAFFLNVAVEIVSARGETKELPRQYVKSRNISKGGICLEMKSIEVDGVHLLSGLPFAREHRLRLSIELAPEAPPLEATGEVQWYDVDRDQPGCVYRLGVAFMEIPGNGKERLTRFLKEHQRDVS